MKILDLNQACCIVILLLGHDKSSWPMFMISLGKIKENPKLQPKHCSRYLACWSKKGISGTFVWSCWNLFRRKNTLFQSVIVCVDTSVPSLWWQSMNHLALVFCSFLLGSCREPKALPLVLSSSDWTNAYSSAFPCILLFSPLTTLVSFLCSFLHWGALNWTVLLQQSHKFQMEGKICSLLPLTAVANTAQFAAGYLLHGDERQDHISTEKNCWVIMQNCFLACQPSPVSGI